MASAARTDRWLAWELVALFCITGAWGLLGSTRAALAFFAACAVVLMSKQMRLSKFTREPARAEVDVQGVRRFLGANRCEEVRWEDLVRVTIMTTDEGPFVEDFFWLLLGRNGKGCAVGQAHATPLKLLERLQRLPGFDNAAVIDASCSVENAQFVCWEGQPGQGTVAATPPAQHSE